MKNYLAYKNQIAGFRDVLETVKTVEKISASSIHLFKQEVALLNSYIAAIEQSLNRLLDFYQEKNHPLLRQPTSAKKALIILTGDKGLTGGLWHKIIGWFINHRQAYQSIVVVGTKGKQYLSEENIPFVKWFPSPEDVFNSQDVQPIRDFLFEKFKNGSFPQIDVLYPRFISVAKQEAMVTGLLPFAFLEQKRANQTKNGLGLPIFEPSKKDIFNRLLQKYIGVFFQKIVLEARLSELSARTVAMEHAAAKTDELIKKLILNYLDERRISITQKQLEAFSVHKII